MAKDTNAPKVKDKFKTVRKIKITKNTNITVLSSVTMNDLPKGTEGQIFKIDAKHIYAAFKAFSKTKYDLDLKIKKGVWTHFIS